MLFFNCNILHGAPITELFWVCLVVSQILGEGALVQMFCWYAREKWGSLFSLVAYEDCLEVCFVGLLVERFCVWRLVIVAILMVWGMFKSHQLGLATQVTKGGFFS